MDQTTNTSPTQTNNHWMRYLILAASLLLLVAIFFIYRGQSEGVATQTSPDIAPISQNALEERAGLRVRLIGVTAGGGMIDFRLKMIDPDKAQAFLQDPANLPITMVAEDGTRLFAAGEMEDDIIWEEGGILFMLLPNSGGVVQPGDPVLIEFGGIQLEPIQAQ